MYYLLTWEVLSVFGVNEVGQITTIIQDHVQWFTIGKNNSLKCTLLLDKELLDCMTMKLCECVNINIVD